LPYQTAQLAKNRNTAQLRGMDDTYFQAQRLSTQTTRTPSQLALPKARPEGAKRLWRAATGRALREVQKNFNRTGKSKREKFSVLRRLVIF